MEEFSTNIMEQLSTNMMERSSYFQNNIMEQISTNMMERSSYFKKYYLMEMFGSDITDEIATILSTMNERKKHTILHISRSPYYQRSKNIHKNCGSDGRKTCTCISVSDKGENKKCKNLRGYWWCVECTYKTPLAPVYLCSDCANIDTESSTNEKIIHKNKIHDKSHFNDTTSKNFFDKELNKKRKIK